MQLKMHEWYKIGMIIINAVSAAASVNPGPGSGDDSVSFAYPQFMQILL